MVCVGTIVIRRYIGEPSTPWRRLRGLVAKESLRSIAGRVGRPASTLSREVARNGGVARYRAARAHRAAHARARRPKEHKLARHRDLARAVEGGLETRWSPEQIANRLRL
jgi:IS30 family transposase